MHTATHALKIALCMGVASLVFATTGSAQDVTGNEIVEKCTGKYPGEDQRTKLTIIVRDKDGNERRNVYQRLWKDFKGQNNIADKMVLFTEFPPEAKGNAFMRWAFVPAAGKNADQWIYLPVMRKTRRVSIRDPGDSFLGSDLTYADISPRGLDQDEHKLLKTETRDGGEYYVVESTPKEADPLYSKRVRWFKKDPQWANCVMSAVIYYDGKGEILKKQSLDWQKVQDAWLWKKVEVQNVQTQHSSVFEVDDAEVNVDLAENVFTERSLKKGYSQ